MTPADATPPAAVLRYRWELLGAHIHVRVFVAPAREATFALAGTLVFDADTWPAVLAALTGAAPGAIDFLEERGA